MPVELKDAVAVVTGAASGIGRAAALAFAAAGSDVVVSDIDAAGSEAVAEQVREAGREALVVGCDVADRAQVEALVGRSVAWKGHCDVFVSNAGVGVGGPPHTVPLDDWEWIVDINMWSHVWAVRAVLPHMLERGSGHLVHTASSAGILGFPSLIPYCLTKFAVVGLAESLAVWGADKGIGVSVVCPLVVNTNIHEGSRTTPEDGVTPEALEVGRSMVKQIFEQTGLPPERVAEDIVDAVRAGRLYVFPHPELADMLQEKWRDPDAWVRSSAEAWATQRRMLEQLSTGAGAAGTG